MLAKSGLRPSLYRSAMLSIFAWTRLAPSPELLRLARLIASSAIRNCSVSGTAASSAAPSFAAPQSQGKGRVDPHR
jgi:hypothetical protein